MMNLSLAPFVAPKKPADTTTTMELELWKREVQEYKEKCKTRKKNSDQVFALILGQCSPALRAKLELNNDWTSINSTSDVMPAGAHSELHGTEANPMLPGPVTAGSQNQVIDLQARSTHDC